MQTLERRSEVTKRFIINNEITKTTYNCLAFSFPPHVVLMIITRTAFTTFIYFDFIEFIKRRFENN